jgi:1-aminocyclopropane-1-carboxylate deaminase/D-cysteine desulfhydrase-like pyridoxal-dependent ACC family enzyme
VQQGAGEQPPRRSQIHCPGLPLAVYREVAAHLRQVIGVEAELIAQTSQQFDYTESQIAGLLIQYTEAVDLKNQERVSQILAYYQNRYGAWEDVTAEVVP